MPLAKGRCRSLICPRSPTAAKWRQPLLGPSDKDEVTWPVVIDLAVPADPAFVGTTGLVAAAAPVGDPACGRTAPTMLARVNGKPDTRLASARRLLLIAAEAGGPGTAGPDWACDLGGAEEFNPTLLMPLISGSSVRQCYLALHDNRAGRSWQQNSVVRAWSGYV